MVDRWRLDGGQLDVQTNQRVIYQIDSGFDGSLKGLTRGISSIDTKYIEEIRTGPADKIKIIDETTVSMRHVNNSTREEAWLKE